MRNTLERNGEQVIKNAGTGDKGCWNRWEAIRKQVRKAGRTCINNAEHVIDNTGIYYNRRRNR